MSLRTKIILVLLLFSTVPVVVIGYIATVWSTRSLERQIGESSLEFARLSLLRITESLYTKFETVNSWPYAMNLVEVMETGHLSEVSSTLDYLATIHDEYYYIVLADPYNIVASSDRTLIGSQLPPFSGLAGAMNGKPKVKDVAFNPIAGGHSLVITVPIKRPGDDSKIIGVLSVALKWQEVNRMITGLQIDGQSQDIDNHLMLINNDGLVISCFGSEEMFTTNLIDIGMASARYACQHDDGYLVETSEHGSESFITYTYQKRFEDILGLKWSVLFLQDPDRVFASARAFAKTSAWLLPVIIGGFAVVSVIFAGRLTKPILAIASAAKLLGKGDLSARVPITSRDEIGTLANSFNTMAENLQQAQSDRDEAEHAVRKSQAHLQEGERISHCGSWEWNLADNTNFWSPEYYRIFGYDPDQVQPDHNLFIKAIHPEDRDRVVKFIERALKGGEVQCEIEFRVVRPDKTERIVYCNAEIIRDASGKPIRVTGVDLDITERRRAEEKLLYLSSAVEQNKEGVAVADMDGCLQYVNKAFAEMHGLGVDEALGQHLSIFHTPEQMQEVEEVNQQIIETGAFNGEVWHVRRDGSVFCGHMYNTLMYDEQGRPIGIIATLRDITASKQMAEELDVYREQINRTERLAALGTLSATVAHELNQPLTVIRLMLQNCLVELQESKASRTIIDSIEDSLAEIDKSSGIIQRFLTASRPPDRMSIRQVDIGKIPERIAGLFAHSARRARISLNLGKELPDILPCVCGSADMEQIFFILTENAIQAADGSRQRRLDVSGSCENGQVELKFSDDCCGIAAEDIKRIFEPFFTTKPREEGTGLGLSIVKRILDHRDGSIRVESAVGKGTTFHITLPTYDHCC